MGKGTTGHFSNSVVDQHLSTETGVLSIVITHAPAVDVSIPVTLPTDIQMEMRRPLRQ